jgi:hypothetical protein
LRSAYAVRHHGGVDDELISREELTAYLFNVADMHDDLARIRGLPEGENGEGPEEDS